MIKSCDAYGLYNYNINVFVKENNHPDFVGEIETSFTLEVNETLTYELPDTYDPEGNDSIEVYV